MSTKAPIKEDWKKAIEAAAIKAYADWNEKINGEDATIDDRRKFNEFNAKALGVGADAQETGIRAHLVINLNGGVSVASVKQLPVLDQDDIPDIEDAIEVHDTPELPPAPAKTSVFQSLRADFTAELDDVVGHVDD